VSLDNNNELDSTVAIHSNAQTLPMLQAYVSKYPLDSVKLIGAAACKQEV